MPALLHSAMACAVVCPVGMSTHAASAGQTRRLQSGALYTLTSLLAPHPLKQLHLLFTVSHVPCPLQLFIAVQLPDCAGDGMEASKSKIAAVSRAIRGICRG